MTTALEVEEPLLNQEEKKAENQETEQEIADILCVDQKPLDKQPEIKAETPDQPKIKEAFVPTGIRTRQFLIDKIKESAKYLGNEAEVKSMQLHRRRKNSLTNILREQVARGVEQQAEKEMGIPEDHDGRVDYCVNLLYSFDLCLCKALEKGLHWFDAIPFELENLAETIDNDERISTEIKGSFRDWIKESEQMQSWCEQCASPSTRLLLCHIYPIMSCLKKKGATRPIPTHIQLAAASGKIRSVLQPVKPLPQPSFVPKGMRMV